MSIQRLWKCLTMNNVPPSSTCVSIPILLRCPLAIIANPHIKMAKFFTGTTIPSSTPLDRAIVTDFFINKCGMTEKDVSKALKYHKGLFHKSRQNLEEGLELLSEHGLTIPAQIRRVVLHNPGIFLYKSERDLKSRLIFLRSIMKSEDICKLLYTNSSILDYSEDRLKSAISKFQRLGVEGEALWKLVTSHPRLVTYTEEKIMESFNVAEGLGFEKGSPMFGYALRFILLGKEKIYRKLQLLSSLGFSEKQVYQFSSRKPWILGLSEGKLKRNVDFLVKSLGFSLDDTVKCTALLTCNLERRTIPRYRVMEALKSMQLLKKKRFPLKIFNLTEKCFLEKYVNLNVESSSLLRDIYYGAKVGKLDH